MFTLERCDLEGVHSRKVPWPDAFASRGKHVVGSPFQTEVGYKHTFASEGYSDVKGSSGSDQQGKGASPTHWQAYLVI
jgi:hypothetical protein